jgi:hypothetical protein
MDIGPFYAKETVLYDSEGAVYHSGQLRSLVPYRCTYGYDVLVYVGRALFLHCGTEQQIIEELRRKNISISPREIGYLGRKFIVYLAIAHRQSRQRLKKVMALRGGYILHIDGTCEGDSPHLLRSHWCQILISDYHWGIGRGKRCETCRNGVERCYDFGKYCARRSLTNSLIAFADWCALSAWSCEKSTGQ